VWEQDEAELRRRIDELEKDVKKQQQENSTLKDKIEWVMKWYKVRAPEIKPDFDTNDPNLLSKAWTPTQPNTGSQNRVGNVLGAARTSKQMSPHTENDAQSSVEAMGIAPSTLPTADVLHADPDDATDSKGTELKTIKQLNAENEHIDFEKDAENKQMTVYGPHPQENYQSQSREIVEPEDIDSKIAQIRDFIGSMFSENVIRVALKHNNYTVTDNFVLGLLDLDPEKIAQYEKEAQQLKKA